MIYPNPAKDLLTVSSEPSLMKNLRISVLDNMGRQVLLSGQATFNVSSLAPGLYYLRIESEGSTGHFRFFKD